MVKRFLCLLTLMCVLVTGTATCEGAYQANITLDYSHEAADAMAKQITEDESQRETVAQALVDLVESLYIQLTLQESGARFTLKMKDSVLLDFSIFGTETEGFVLSNFLPEHYVHTAISQEKADLAAQALEQIGKTDWTSVLKGVSAELATWLEEAYEGQEIGNFMGDAYEGGARRLTFTFDDASIAGLMDAAISILADHGIDDVLLAAWLGEEGLLNQLIAYNGEIAAANQYSYTAYLVLNEVNSPIGISLLIVEDDEQVMTLSVGIGDNGWHIVWGYGLNQENIYIDFVLIDGQNETDKDFSMTVYKDPYREGFRAVEPYLDYMQMLYSGTMGFAESDMGAVWFADVEIYEASASEPNAWLKVDGEYSRHAATIDQTIGWYLSDDDNAQPAEAICFSLEPCEPMILSTEGLHALDVEDASFESDVSEIMSEAMGELVIELFKLIPASLMMYILQ